MKRVMYVHHGDVNGGAPRSLHFLLERLDRDEYDPILVYRSNEADGEYFSDACPTVVYEPGIRPFHGSTVSGMTFKQAVYNFIYALPSYFTMKKLVKKYKPDIVHLNSTCLFMCSKAVKSVNTKVTTICHVREPLLDGVWGDLLRFGCRGSCDKFVAIDSYDGKTVDSNGRKTTVVYNFVDFSEYNIGIESDVLRRELNLCDQDVIFLSLARVSPENGILEIVQQWSDFVKDNRSHLVVVGEIEGREVDYCSRCHEIADDRGNIHILPFRKDPANAIASADVILCPFTQPHFARGIIEGAAMGKPALSTDIEGPRELVVDGTTGRFYHSGDELKELVGLFTVNGKYREELGERAEKFAREKFNADTNAGLTFQLYEDCQPAW